MTIKRWGHERTQTRSGMSRLRYAWIAAAGLISVTMLMSGCEPIGPIAGGQLRGPVDPMPVADWSFAASEQTLGLETRPDDPYSVNVWFASIDERLYVASTVIPGEEIPTDRVWVANVEADARVRVGLGGRVIARRAERVLDPKEIGQVFSAYEAKYGRKPGARDPEREVWIYRLGARAD
jgi:hypothetical protein